VAAVKTPLLAGVLAHEDDILAELSEPEHDVGERDAEEEHTDMLARSPR
jgi:hypothetical protein